MLKAIIFDLDNTLCDTNSAVVPSFDTCFRYLKNYYPNINKKEFFSLTKKIFDKLTRKQKIPLYTSQALFWHEMFERLQIEISPTLIKDLIILFDDDLARNVKLFKNVEKMLKELKKRNLTLAVLSNGSYIGKALRFEFLNLKPYIDLLISSDLIRRDKPSRRAFMYILRKLKIKSDEAIFVGDELEADILGAGKVGFTTILNTWNNQILNSDKKIKPNYIAKSPLDVVKIVDKLL